MSGPMVVSQGTMIPKAPRLLDQVRAMALAHYGRPEPGERYAGWATRFILFQGKRHPNELGIAEIRQFLEHVAKSENRYSLARISHHRREKKGAGSFIDEGK